MKKKLFLVLALAVLTVSVAGCGFYGVQGQNTAGFINKNQVSKIKPGVSENYILARFGKPERVATTMKSEPNGNELPRTKWIYCGNHKNTTTFLTFFHTTSQKNQCVIFKFNHGGKLVKATVKNY
jgi:outer membrane protein assembly factor BamE (lipoprotein component of BamABCDE complex)